jgi:hypothetical protein
MTYCPIRRRYVVTFREMWIEYRLNIRVAFRYGSEHLWWNFR